MLIAGPVMKLDLFDNDQSQNSTFRVWFKDEAPNKATVYLTTEANAYGAVLLRWFDGKVHPYTMEKGKHHEISIAEVIAYDYLPWGCAANPYYHCMAQQLSGSKQCSKYGQPCTNISLPTDKQWQGFQLCTTQEHA